jgi:hypothetical protein
VFNHRGIDLFGMHRPEHHSGMLHLADWFSGRPNSKEGIDLPYLCNSRNNLAHGQMLNNFNREAALIAISIAAVRTTLSKIVRGPGSLIKGKGSNQNNQNKGKRPMMQVRQGRVNFTTLAEIPDGAPVMSGTFSIHHKPVCTLFD